jgi:tetratricopeptide (TPR) repeat protein
LPRPSARAPFVGRDRELAALAEVFDDAITGRGRLVVISGEPGIGKTRLSDEFGRLASDRGGLVLWGRAWADAGAPPFWPWIQAFRGYLAAVDSATAFAELRPFAEDIAQLVPDVRTVVPELEVTDIDPSEPARFRTFDSVARFLRVAGSARPLVVILDDLQAMDAASMHLLRFVAAQLDATALLIIGTIRVLESAGDPGADPIAGLRHQPAFVNISLAGLPTPAVANLLAVETGTRPDRALVRSLAEATSGNPLFVNEAIRLLAADGQLDDSTIRTSQQRLAIPASIQAVIHDRLDHLPEQTRALLRRAAAIGPEFETRLLSRVMNRRGDSGEIGGSETLESLDVAVRAGLVHDLGTGTFRFAHDLVRQSLYRELEPAQRFELHAHIAAAIESDPDADGSLAELAFHFSQAELATHYGLPRPRIDPTIVIAYAVRASRRARATLAFEDAATLDRLALRTLDDHPTAAGPTRLELLLDLGDAEARAGDLSAARRNFLAAAAIARETRAGSEIARAALGYGGRFIWSRAGDDSEVTRLLGEAIELLEETDGDRQLLVRVTARLACAWRSDMAHREDSDRLSARALETARTLGDPATLTFALAGRFWATYWPENPGERLAIADELLAVAREAGDVERTYDGHQARCAALLDLGRIADARTQVIEARTAAVASRQPSQLVGIHAYEVVLALLTGRFADAEPDGVDADSDSVVNAIRDDIATATIHRFFATRERGNPADVEDAIRNAIEAFPWYPYFRPALVCLLLDVGREEEARLHFRELVADRFGAIYPDCEWFLGMALAAEACSRLEDAQGAATLYERLLPFAGRHAVAHAEGSMGAVDRYLGLLAQVLGREDRAAEHFADAVAVNTRLESPPWTGHTQADWADAILRSGARDGPERARALLDAARTVAVRHAMRGLMSKVESIGRTHDRVLRASATERTLVAGAVTVGPTTANGTTIAVFRRAGEYWTLRFDDTGCQLQDSKGMRYLAALLANPGREFHVVDLVSAIPTGKPAHDAPGRSGAGGSDSVRLELGDAGEMLDAEARRAYRERLFEIDSDLAEAEKWNDPERVALLVAEREALVDQLAAAVGLGGRSRVAHSNAERARLSVAKALRSALRRIESGCPPLGRHLDLSIHTGTFCRYAPDPGLRLKWDVGSGTET